MSSPKSYTLCISIKFVYIPQLADPISVSAAINLFDKAFANKSLAASTNFALDRDRDSSMKVINCSKSHRPTEALLTNAFRLADFLNCLLTNSPNDS